MFGEDNLWDDDAPELPGFEPEEANDGAFGGDPDPSGIGSMGVAEGGSPYETAGPASAPGFSDGQPGEPAMSPMALAPMPQGFYEPAAARSAGMTFLVGVAAFGVGLATGGGWGGLAGVLGTGAVFNGYRAQKWWGSQDPSQKHEAMVSGVMALGTAAAAVYAVHKASQRQE